MANKNHEEAHIKDEDLRAQASPSTGELGTAGSDAQGNVTLGAGAGVGQRNQAGLTQPSGAHQPGSQGNYLGNTQGDFPGPTQGDYPGSPSVADGDAEADACGPNECRIEPRD